MGPSALQVEERVCLAPRGKGIRLQYSDLPLCSNLSGGDRTNRFFFFFFYNLRVPLLNVFFSPYLVGLRGAPRAAGACVRGGHAVVQLDWQAGTSSLGRKAQPTRRGPP